MNREEYVKDTKIWENMHGSFPAAGLPRFLRLPPSLYKICLQSRRCRQISSWYCGWLDLFLSSNSEILIIQSNCIEVWFTRPFPNFHTLISTVFKISHFYKGQLCSYNIFYTWISLCYTLKALLFVTIIISYF